MHSSSTICFSNIESYRLYKTELDPLPKFNPYTCVIYTIYIYVCIVAYNIKPCDIITPVLLQRNEENVSVYPKAFSDYFDISFFPLLHIFGKTVRSQ